MGEEHLIGNEQFTTVATTQVYKVTHDGEGNSLPFMYKSFISFSYGGKNIEDFNLIASIDQNQLVKPIYGKFEDLVTQAVTLDGQYYWGTHFTNNDLNFTLVTDGMTQQQLDNFREWFAPGVMKELILAEHPNRAIMARIAEPPTMSIIPFEEPATIKIAGINYATSTTLYKGSISLVFVMDELTWYSKLTYMPLYINKNTLEPSDSENGINTINDKDMIKIMVEDGIPHQSILETQNGSTFFLGNNILVTSEARTEHAIVGTTHLGIITGESDGLNVSSNTPQYLFYSGTAKCYPKIKFSIAPTFEGYYISCPRNIILTPKITVYSYIQIGDKKFYFTTPSLLTGYNQAIKIFESAANKTKIELLNEIRNKINERYSRAWAAGCLNSLTSNDYLNNKLISSSTASLQNKMKTFINPDIPFTFTIDSKTGEAIGEFSIKILNNASATVDNIDSFTTIKENVGDMILSDYLVIEGRNQINSSGYIEMNKCHKIQSNDDLFDFLIFFKDMYL